MTKPFTAGHSTIVMSNDSAAHYGAWAQEFANWAETQNIGLTVLITPEDLIPDGNYENLSDAERGQALISYMRENHPEFPLQRLYNPEEFDRKINGLGDNAVRGAGRAESADLNGNGVNDIGIIIAPSRAETKEQHVARMGGVREENLAPVRGTDLEWQITTIAHEIGHLSQPDKSRNMNLVWEIEAEQNMVHFMQDATAKGMLSDPAILDDATLSRNLRSFYFKDDLSTHVVGPAVRTPSEGPVPVGDNDRFFQDPLHNAQMHVSFSVGKDLINDDHRRKSLFDMLGNRGVYNFDSYRLPHMETEHRKTLFGIAKGDIPMAEGLATLPENVQTKIADNIQSETQILGIGALRDDPALMYEMTRRAYLLGEFDDNPIGKQYAYEFLNAAQKIAPDEFSVTNREEKFTPPTFAQTDTLTPPQHTHDHDHSHTLPGVKF